MKITSILLSAFSFASAVLLASCSFFVTRPEPVNTGVIDADNHYIQYIGRFDFSDPKRVVFDWPGVFICAKFTGTSCSVRLADSTDEYAITIDDRAPRLLTIGTSQVYKVASGLCDTIPHTIMVQKRTEPLVGMGAFMGFILDSGAVLLPPPERPGRRIEFIGNSITSGFGVLGDSSGCKFSPQTEDAGLSYAGITARELDADYHMISYSGRGVVRNYGDKNRTSLHPMPSLYDRVCCSDSIQRWDFSKWVPQTVVINLGTNDFSTEPYPDSAVFEAAYNMLVDTVRTNYPGVTIFCVSGPMIGEPCTHYVRDVVAEQQLREGRDKDIFFIEIPRSIMTDTDWGCAMHPNIYGANKMADVVAPMIRLRMNW